MRLVVQKTLGPPGTPIPQDHDSRPASPVGTTGWAMATTRPRAAMTTPARNARSLVIALSLVRNNDAGRVTTHNRIGLQGLIHTIEDQGSNDCASGMGTDGDVV